MRRATTPADVQRLAQEFLSTPSVRRATRHLFTVGLELPISIHALREEGDQSCASICEVGDGFLSTPSVRRATAHVPSEAEDSEISIHALREEGDVPEVSEEASFVISIHALREEGDQGH